MKVSEKRLLIGDDHGDPNAPPGSREWSLHLANEIRTSLHEKESTGQRLQRLTESFKKYQGWKHYGYESWDEFCKKRLHKSAGEIDAEAENRIVAQAGEAEQNPTRGHGGDRRSKDYQVYNYTLDSAPKGTAAKRLSARIARDRPDILEDMKAGKYRSVRAAAIDAGIIDPVKSKRYQLPTDPSAAGRYMRERVGEDWLEKFIAAFKS